MCCALCVCVTVWPSDPIRTSSLRIYFRVATFCYRPTLSTMSPGTTDRDHTSDFKTICLYCFGNKGCVGPVVLCYMLSPLLHESHCTKNQHVCCFGPKYQDKFLVVSYLIKYEEKPFSFWFPFSVWGLTSSWGRARVPPSTRSGTLRWWWTRWSPLWQHRPATWG